MDLTFQNTILLIIAGLLAGIINILAGSGSILTLGLMAILGIPANIANATNRLGILIFGISGSFQFHKKGELDLKQSKKAIIICFIGGILGAIGATLISKEGLNIVLGCVFFIFLFIVGFQTEKRLKLSAKSSPYINPSMFLIGMYAGFIQIGTGIALLLVLKILLNQKFQKLNPLKVFIITGINLLALIVFYFGDLINWPVAIVLSVGQIIGSVIGVKINSSKMDLELPIRITLLILILISIGKFWGFY